jgi:hypothetical protein
MLKKENPIQSIRVMAGSPRELSSSESMVNVKIDSRKLQKALWRN